MDPISIRARTERPCAVVWGTVEGAVFRRNAPHALYGSCLRKSTTSSTFKFKSRETEAHLLGTRGRQAISSIRTADANCSQ
jgi:hypothetical protein